MQNNEFPLISIIVPVYNTGCYLNNCVDSILHQDYPNTEILLVDDGSKDQPTIELCNHLAKSHTNVTCYHKQNGGSASARNFGIERAKGKYIGFIDSDDEIEPDMFSCLYKNLVTNNVKVAIGAIATEENGKLIDKIAPLPTGIYCHKEFMHHFMLGSFHSSCTNLYERTLFDCVKFPENEVNEDYMLNYWVFKTLDRIHVSDKVFYHYIRRAGSNTSSPASLKFLDWIKHTKLILTEMKDVPDLLAEAEYQYLYSNIILANKSLLTLGRMKSEDATKLYDISTQNLQKDREMMHSNKYLNGRYRMMALWMSRCPRLYKWAIIALLKVKNVLS